MSAYLEVMVAGNCRAFFEANSIVGVMMSPSCTGSSIATPEEPITLVMRSGEVLQGVYGISAERLLLYAAGAKLLLREEGRLLVVAYLDQHAEFEAKIEHHLSRKSGHG